MLFWTFSVFWLCRNSMEFEWMDCFSPFVLKKRAGRRSSSHRLARSEEAHVIPQRSIFLFLSFTDIYDGSEFACLLLIETYLSDTCPLFRWQIVFWKSRIFHIIFVVGVEEFSGSFSVREHLLNSCRTKPNWKRPPRTFQPLLSKVNSIINQPPYCR